MATLNYTFCDLDAVFPWLEDRLNTLSRQGFKCEYRILIGDNDIIIVEFKTIP